MGIEPDRFNILNDVKTMVKLSKISIQNNPDQKSSTGDNQKVLQVRLPVVKIGRPTFADKAAYQQQMEAFCTHLKELRLTLDFIPSARGWCYYLEGLGVITKGEFDTAQRIINDCRKSGMLPINICAVDESRVADGVHTYSPDGTDFESWAEDKISSIKYDIDNIVESATDDPASDYFPFDWMDFQDNYIEMMVEKIDLIGIFKPICQKYGIPLSNRRGWGDINSNAALMRRFQEWENEGKQCILLYCGDHDPGGLHISDFIKKNLNDLRGAVGWSPDNLIIDRFGLNYDFIEANNLTWIDNLETAGKDQNGLARHLDDPDHRDFNKSYVKDYIKQFGNRKVEANALMSNIPTGRKLCEDSILKYMDKDGIDIYHNRTAELCQLAEDLILKRLSEDGYTD